MHTDKPLTLSIRDYIIRRLSPQLRLSEDDIAAVISHQYASGNAATKISNEVEFSGLGKFMFSPKKANKKLKNLLNMQSSIERLKTVTESPSRLVNYDKKLIDLALAIEYIQQKLENQ